MSFFTAERFARKRGLDALNRFVEMVCRDCPLAKIAAEFKLSIAEACHLRKTLFRREWKPAEGLTDYLKFQQWSKKEESEELGATILRLNGTNTE